MYEGLVLGAEELFLVTFFEIFRPIEGLLDNVDVGLCQF